MGVLNVKNRLKKLKKPDFFRNSFFMVAEAGIEPTTSRL